MAHKDADTGHPEHDEWENERAKDDQTWIPTKQTPRPRQRRRPQRQDDQQRAEAITERAGGHGRIHFNYQATSTGRLIITASIRAAGQKAIASQRF